MLGSIGVSLPLHAYLSLVCNTTMLRYLCDILGNMKNACADISLNKIAPMVTTIVSDRLCCILAIAIVYNHPTTKVHLCAKCEHPSFKAIS